MQRSTRPALLSWASVLGENTPMSKATRPIRAVVVHMVRPSEMGSWDTQTPATLSALVCRVPGWVHKPTVVGMVPCATQAQRSEQIGIAGISFLFFLPLSLVGEGRGEGLASLFSAPSVVTTRAFFPDWRATRHGLRWFMLGWIVLGICVAVATTVITLIWWWVGDQWADEEYKKFGHGGGAKKRSEHTRVIQDFDSPNPVVIKGQEHDERNKAQ